jgi:hypothetical protein
MATAYKQSPFATMLQWPGLQPYLATKKLVPLCFIVHGERVRVTRGGALILR